MAYILAVLNMTDIYSVVEISVLCFISYHFLPFKYVVCVCAHARAAVYLYLEIFDGNGWKGFPDESKLRVQWLFK